MLRRSDIRPLIFWEGFPPCGLVIKQVADAYGDDLAILGTRPAVPFEGLEERLGHPITWLDHPDDIWRRRDEFGDRNFIIHTGWAHPGWLRFDRWIRARGAKVVVTVDNRLKADFRQAAGAVWYRLWLRRHFDAAFVPGRSATMLMRWLGMPADRIFTGYYGAFEEIYRLGRPMAERRPEFLFVGQLIERKGVDVLLAAFHRYRAAGGRWALRIVGTGPLQPRCQGDGIIYEGFAQAQRTAALMQEARCLVLASREDHWGTVVCEAAASGMALICSRWVGAAPDLLRSAINGWRLARMDDVELASLFARIEQWDLPALDHAQRVSTGLAAGYTSFAYAAAFDAMTQILLPEAAP